MATTQKYEQQFDARKPTHLDDEFKQWVSGLLDKLHIPGASVAVIDSGRVETASFGMAQLPDVPATSDTLWRMASTTKAHTAAVTGLLIQAGTEFNVANSANAGYPDGKKEKLKWSTPISKILEDDFVLPDEYITKNLTIEDALSNRSSMSGHDFNYGPYLGSNIADLTRTLKHLGPILHPFRTKFQYSNTMFALVGQVLEKIERKTFDEICRERLWGPLGMDNTFAGFTSQVAPPTISNNDGRNLARGYYWVPDSEDDEDSKKEEDSSDKKKGHYVSQAHILIDIVGPAGSVISSVNDYSKWVAALLQAVQPPKPEGDGSEDGEKKDDTKDTIISHDLWKDLTTARTLIHPSQNFFPDINPNADFPNIRPDTYALGWFTGPWMYPNEIIVHHSGGLPGFGSEVLLLPKHNFGVVVAGNAGFYANRLADQITRELVGKKIGVEKDERRREGEHAFKKADRPSQEKKAQSSQEDAADSIKATNITAMPENTAETKETSAKALPDTFDSSTVAGMYSHPAYGQIKVNLVDGKASLSNKNAIMDGNRIIRKSLMADYLGKSESKSESSGPVFHVDFQGDRAFHFSLLLHPPAPATKSVHTEQNTFLTLEKMWSHGSMTEDCVPDLPQGLGKEDDENYPFKQEAVWESVQTSACGASFEVTAGSRGRRLGVILANTESTEAAMREADMKDLPLEDWKDKMVWFEKLE